MEAMVQTNTFYRQAGENAESSDHQSEVHWKTQVISLYMVGDTLLCRTHPSNRQASIDIQQDTDKEINSAETLTVTLFGL